MNGNFKMRIGGTPKGPNSSDTHGGINDTPVLYQAADMVVAGFTGVDDVFSGEGNVEMGGVATRKAIVAEGIAIPNAGENERAGAGDYLIPLSLLKLSLFCRMTFGHVSIPF